MTLTLERWERENIRDFNFGFRAIFQENDYIFGMSKN